MNEQIDQVTSITIGSCQIDILGTAHISKVSRDSVRVLLENGDYDTVAVELCQRRYQSIVEPEAVAEMNLWEVVKQGKAMTMTAMLVLGAYQQRLAEQLGIEVGAEVKEAIHIAQQRDLPIVLVDRDIGATLKRLHRTTPWWKRWTLLSALVVHFFNRSEIDDEQVEDIKRGDMFESMFKEMEIKHWEVGQVLITERDRYMAAKILEYVETHKPTKMFVVVGMGHLRGICDLLKEATLQPADEMKSLDYVPPASKLIKILPWAIVAVILGGFVVGFRHGMDVGMELVYAWVLINGGLASLGAALAGAQLLTIAAAFVAAPLTSINPTIGAGMVTAMVELMLRKPKVTDFVNLRRETTSLKGWHRNNVARVLLIFVLSTLGSAAGTYIGGVYIYQQIL